MKRAAVLFLTAVLIFTSACGNAAVEALPPLPTATETPIIIDDSPADPVPTPVEETEEKPEPEYSPGPTLILDGRELSSGSYMVNGSVYISFTDMADSLGIEYQQPELDNAWSFIFRTDAFTLTAFESSASKNAEIVEMKEQVLWWHGEAYVGVDSICALLGISVCTDSEGRMCCTPGAGEWSVEAGHNVPVLLYRAIGDDIWGEDKLFVSPKQFDEQLEWLIAQGYEPIWFSDLANIQNYEKPIIITFDDGYAECCSQALPILQKYNVKATVFLITGYSVNGAEHYLNHEQITVMADSGLVEFQSNTYSHPVLTGLSEEELKGELSQSKEDILRLTGKEPFVLSYPNGTRNTATDEAVRAYYRFAVVYGGTEYVTGGDEMSIFRYTVLRGSSIEQLKALLY